MSVAAVSWSAAAAAIRSRMKAMPSSIPVAAARQPSVSTASNRCSLSSCMSLL